MTERFIVAGYDENSPMLIIGSASWWIDNEEDIFTWCRDTECLIEQKGMVLFFETLQDREWFALRWQ